MIYSKEKKDLIRLKFIVLCTLLFVLFAISLFGQTTYYSRVTNGDWDKANTWSNLSCDGAVSVSTPTINDNVVICTGHYVNLTGETKINNLTVQDGGVLDDKFQGDMKVYGNLILNGEYTGSMMLKLFGSGTTNDGTGIMSSINPEDAAYSSPKPLPTNLLSFAAFLLGDMVHLLWSTITESNNDFFSIQRSKDGQNYDDIFHVQGSGTTSTAREYARLDSDPLSGISYYRLKQTDFYGQSEIFPPVEINYELKEEMSMVVDNNPANDFFLVNIIGGEQEPVLLTIFDIIGKEHYSKLIRGGGNGYDLKIPMKSELASGVYMFQASTKNWKQSRKVVVQ